MKLSIITINWNNAIGLKKTIESVIPQLDGTCEYIIIDGKSDDGSLGIIEKYQKKISFWLSEPKEGIYTDMNKGIRQAKGKYCLFLNSGDWLKENMLASVIQNCTGEDIIYFNSNLSHENERFEELKYPPKLTLQSFYNRTIGHQSTLIKTRLFQKYGLYNENFTIHSDYEFWIKTIIRGNCTTKYVDMAFSFYDMGGRSSKPNESSLKEISSILCDYIPERIISDYKYWYKKEKELDLYYWVKSKKIIYLFWQGLFIFAKGFSKLKKKLINV